MIIPSIKDYQRRKFRFFLSANKHTKQSFQNHTYFSNHTHQKLRLPKQISQKRMFVNTPPDFGLQNTYKYLAKANKRRVETLGNQINKQQTNRYKTIQLSQDSPRYLRDTQASSWRKNEMNKMILPILVKDKVNDEVLSKTELRINIIHVKNAQTFEELSRRKLDINIATYVISSFSRCNIDFNLLTSAQLEEIAKMIKIAINIEVTINRPNRRLDKLSNINQLFNLLLEYEVGSIQWAYIIHYFFIPQNQRINEMLMLQLHQQIGFVLQSKLNTYFIEENWLYDKDNGKKIKTIYELLKSGEFVFDTYEGYILYKRILEEHRQKHSLSIKMEKWKSIGLIQSISTVDAIPPKSFQEVYEKCKFRHRKTLTNRKIKIKLKQPFINKDKLIQPFQIFQ